MARRLSCACGRPARDNRLMHCIGPPRGWRRLRLRWPPAAGRLLARARLARGAARGQRRDAAHALQARRPGRAACRWPAQPVRMALHACSAGGADLGAGLCRRGRPRAGGRGAGGAAHARRRQPRRRRARARCRAAGARRDAATRPAARVRFDGPAARRPAGAGAGGRSSPRALRVYQATVLGERLRRRGGRDLLRLRLRLHCHDA